SAAIPLTLRALGGLSTREIAEALLQTEATIAQRISRAKAFITQSAEPFRPPPPDLIDGRLPAVMQIISLIFNEGHAPTSGPRLTRADLADEAIRLARLLHARVEGQPETAGLLALLLLTDARRPARTGPNGELVPLDEQDRGLWNRAMITEGLRLLTDAFAHHALGNYQLRAAIAAVHDQAPTYELTDWSRLKALYDLLIQGEDNPLVRLNRAVVVAHTDGPATALGDIDGLDVPLAEHHRYHATIAYLQQMAGNSEAARQAYATAAALASNEPERRSLLRKAGS
ncbi:MAG TPA: DUF6596 domain-containing protein, partial [Ilumatobacteraceae bacterium]